MAKRGRRGIGTLFIVCFCSSLFGMQNMKKRKINKIFPSHLITLPKDLQSSMLSFVVSENIIETEKIFAALAGTCKTTRGWVTKENRMQLYQMNRIVDPSVVFGSDKTLRGQQFTLLHEAVKNKDRRKLSVLLQIGLDSNVSSGYGHTPLVCAVQKKLSNYVKLLLHYKADTEIADVNGLTPLFHAVQKNNIKIARMLCNAGAHTDGKDVYGRTLLMVAISEEMIKFLQEKNAQW